MPITFCGVSVGEGVGGGEKFVSVFCYSVLLKLKSMSAETFAIVACPCTCCIAYRLRLNSPLDILI